MSRLLATLLLLKNGYQWIQYVSFEHEIESRKSEYYRELMEAQGQRPGEDVYNWVVFFLDCLNKITQQLMQKLAGEGSIASLGPRGKKASTSLLKTTLAAVPARLLRSWALCYLPSKKHFLH